MIATQAFLALLCMISAGLLFVEYIDRRPSIAVFFLLTAAAFFWLIMVDVFTVLGGETGAAPRAVIFRAIMAGAFLNLLWRR